MWTYAQSTGELLKDGEFQGTGYSGAGEGRNNPAMQSVPNVGPIPQGIYAIGPAYHDPHLGPIVMHLDAQAGTEEFERSLFRIHGNNKPNDASHGCIILGPAIRATIAARSDKLLTVIA